MGGIRRICEAVSILRGRGIDRHMQTYLIEDDDGVTVVDPSANSLREPLYAATQELGGIRRIVLTHAHGDHRGPGAHLGAPVLCHADEVVHARSAYGQDYFDFAKLRIPARYVMPKLLARWDGGPVDIADTLAEGDEVAGFTVVHLPGHAPGHIGLWREKDRVLLSGDAFYTLDPQTGIKGRPRIPHRAFNHDPDALRASLTKIAALRPHVAWPGHADPLTGDVASQVEALVT